MRKFTDRIILIFNVLAGAGLLLAYLAPLVNPSRIILPALFGLAYPYLLMGNLVFLCYWMIRLKKEVLISLIVILLGWNHLNNLLPLNFKESKIPETVSPARRFKVLSYNVRGFDIYQWTHEPQVKKEIFGFIEHQEPDILCFQEYYTSTRIGETHADLSKQLKTLPESAVYYTADHTNSNGFGIATFSRYPIIKKSRIPFNSIGNAAMYTDILFRTDTIRIFNIHLQSIKFREGNYAFMDTLRLKYTNEQMREIRDIGSHLKTAFTLRAEQADMISNYIKDSPHPVVVLGDFNDTPQSYAYRRIRKGMQDAFRRAGRGFGNTYAGELPSFRIDYILYSYPIVSYQFQRIKTDFSDHFPITTWLYLPETIIAE
ncbi:MAG: endonuclease/exonuclease/phosphatase family protein [Bacteroidales bacterium]|nr:endonuclease/exonuclease/phosphatase family protein [Bacteroidales bacterium]